MTARPPHQDDPPGEPPLEPPCVNPPWSRVLIAQWVGLGGQRRRHALALMHKQRIVVVPYKAAARLAKHLKRAAIEAGWAEWEGEHKDGASRDDAVNEKREPIDVSVHRNLFEPESAWVVLEATVWETQLRPDDATRLARQILLALEQERPDPMSEC